MENHKLTKDRPLFIVLVLLNIYLINGVVEYSTSGETYIGESFTITYTITPLFAVSAVIKQGGNSRSSCIPTLCSPGSLDNVTFTPSGTGITVVFQPVSISHQGKWQCDNSDGNFSFYTLQPITRLSISTTDGFETGAIVGIVVGCVAIVGFIAGAVFALYLNGLFCFASGRQHERQQPAIQKEATARAGSKVQLLPELTSIQNIMSTEWTHAGNIVKTGNENELMHMDGTIPWVSPRDSGLWHCKLKLYNANDQNFDIRLNVTVHQYEADAGMKVQLLDYMKKSPAFQSVEWYHKELKIPGNELKYQGGTIQVPALYVGKLEEGDAGEYTCKILFKSATLEIPVKLAVKSKGNSSLPPLGTTGLNTGTS